MKKPQIRLTEDEKRYIASSIKNDHCYALNQDDCDCNACLYQIKLFEKLKKAGW